MPKAGSVWLKAFTDKDGNPAIRHSGTIEVEGKRFYLDLYPAGQNGADSPSFTVYMKPKNETNS